MSEPGENGRCSGAAGNAETDQVRAGPGGQALALLRDGSFARVWGAGVLIGTARWIETLAVGIFVIDRTGSAAAVATIGFTRMLPLILLGAVAGTLATYISRRNMLLAGTAVCGFYALALGLLALVGAIALWQIAPGCFLTGILWTADFPVRRTMVADIAGRDRIGAAMALESVTNHATRLVGAGLGGLLMEAVGLQGAFLLGAGMYGIVFLLLLGVDSTDAPASKASTNLLADTVHGFRSIIAESFLLAVMTITVIFNFFGFAYTAMLPVIGRAALHADAAAIGLLAATEAAASLATSLLFAAFAPRRGLGAIYVVGVLIFMAGILAFALSPLYGISLAIMIVTGVGWGGFSATQSTLVLLSSPLSNRARAMGALVICIGVAPLGMLHLGWLAEKMGASTAVAVSAAAGALAILAVMFVFPRILRLDPPGSPTGGSDRPDR